MHGWRRSWRRKTIKDYLCFLTSFMRSCKLQHKCIKAIACNGLILHITWARLSTYVRSCFHDLSRVVFIPFITRSLHAQEPQLEVLGRTNCLICAGEIVYTQQHDMELWLSGWCEGAFIKFLANAIQRVYTCKLSSRVDFKVHELR